MNRLKLEALASSVLIYLIIIVIIFSVALYTPETPKAKNYTEKKSEIIEVSLGSTLPKSSTLKKHKSKKKSQKKPKKPPKKVRNIKEKTQKKVAKIKKAKPKKTTKNNKPSKPNTSNLFKNIPKDIKSDSIKNDKPQGKEGKSLKKVNKSNGIENKYFAKIQNTLKGWPAQSNFAGEKVKVELTIYSTGLFDYKILYRSLNPEFNRSLKAYLEQLKKFGFGAHSNPKPYKIVVEFIAKG